MKKLFIVLLVITTGFYACTGYEDGPAISFRSTSKLLIRAWNVDQFLVDGVDSTQRYYDSCGCVIQFENKDYTPQVRFCSGIISRCDYDKKGIFFSGGYYEPKLVIPFFVTSKWEFKRLSKEDCWMTSTINGKNYYLKLK